MIIFHTRPDFSGIRMSQNVIIVRSIIFCLHAACANTVKIYFFVKFTRSLIVNFTIFLIFYGPEARASTVAT